MRKLFGYSFVFIVSSCLIFGAFILLNQNLLLKSETSTKVAAAGNTYYVSLTGNDTSNGSYASPFRTFNQAKRVLQPGDTLRIFGGTYSEALDITTSGTAAAWITIMPVDGQQVTIDVERNADRTVWLRGNYLKIANMTLKNGDWSCLALSGEYQEVDGVVATGCQSHSIFAGGKHITIKNSTVYDSVLENQNRNPNNGWGSAIKVERGAEDITIDRNTVYHTYGEGIGVTMGRNIKVTNNLVYDNFSVNIYIDNSIDVIVERNISSCTDNPNFTRDGSRPAALALAEETYTGWGSQLANITIRNNVFAFCSTGIADFGAEGSGGGLDHVTIEYNTVWGNLKTPLDLNSEGSKTRNTVIARNIFNNSAGTNPASVANLAGITLHDNYWVTTLPDQNNKTRGTNDVSGTVNFSMTPGYNNFNSFAQTTASAAQNYGVQYGTTPVPTATLVPTSSPTIPASPTPTRVPTTVPSPTPTRVPTVTPTSLPSQSPTPTRLPTTAPTVPPGVTSTLAPTVSPTVRVLQPGDLNEDGFVDQADVGELLSVYAEPATVLPAADLNHDGKINAIDYSLLLDLL